MTAVPGFALSLAGRLTDVGVGLLGRVWPPPCQSSPSLQQMRLAVYVEAIAYLSQAEQVLYWLTQPVSERGGYADIERKQPALDDRLRLPASSTADFLG
jgi:hypothetical protein